MSWYRNKAYTPRITRRPMIGVNVATSRIPKFNPETIVEVPFTFALPIWIGNEEVRGLAETLDVEVKDKITVRIYDKWKSVDRRFHEDTIKERTYHLKGKRGDIRALQNALKCLTINLKGRFLDVCAWNRAKP